MFEKLVWLNLCFYDILEDVRRKTQHNLHFAICNFHSVILPLNSGKLKKSGPKNMGDLESKTRRNSFGEKEGDPIN